MKDSKWNDNLCINPNLFRYSNKTHMSSLILLVKEWANGLASVNAKKLFKSAKKAKEFSAFPSLGKAMRYVYVAITDLAVYQQAFIP